MSTHNIMLWVLIRSASLMSFHELCFLGEIRKIFIWIPLLSGAMFMGKSTYIKSLTLVMLKKLRCHTHSNFQPIRLLDPDCCYKFEYLMANSADPDQLASSTDLDLHCLQRQGISGFSRTRVKTLTRIFWIICYFDNLCLERN